MPEPRSNKRGRTDRPAPRSTQNSIIKAFVLQEDGPWWRAAPRMREIEWRHLDGTICVAGWNPNTGLCQEGYGPVTPRLKGE
jgi:hypothetical protein